MARKREDETDYIEPPEPPEEDPVALTVAAPPPKAIRPRRKEKPPWRGGWLIRHHWFGSMRVRKGSGKGEAKDEAEAVEVFRLTKCPAHALDDIKRNLRVSAVAFVPAETEKHKPIDARPDWEMAK